MIKIESMEKAIKAKNTKDLNATLVRAYWTSQEAENDRLDFSDVIWESDIKECTEFMRENGVKEFTISSQFSSLIETLEGFEEAGCHMTGLTKVNARYADFITGKHEIIPAILIKL